MFHCSFTGACLWKRSIFLLGLIKGISESLFDAFMYMYIHVILWVFYDVNFSACVIVNMLTYTCIKRERVRCRPVHVSWIIIWAYCKERNLEKQCMQGRVAGRAGRGRLKATCTCKYCRWIDNIRALNSFASEAVYTRNFFFDRL